MTSCKNICIVANMGTLGDFKPAFLAAAFLAFEGSCVVVIAQPKHEEFVVQKMDTAMGFVHREEEHLLLDGVYHQHTFILPKGGPPDVRSGEEWLRIAYHFKKLTYASMKGGSLVLYFPTVPSGMNEDEYQNVSEVGKAAVKKATFGVFLSSWQGAFSALKSQENFPNIFVTNCYDREPNMAMFDEAMGLSNSLKLRVGHLGLVDVDLSDKWHANSNLLAPCELFGKDVTSVKKQGVIVEPNNVFPAQSLSDDVANFLEAKPSVVVVLSSVSVQWIQAIQNLLPGSDDYHVLFVNNTSTEPLKAGHFCFPGPLAALEAAFASASLVVHGGSVGVSEQVVRSGTPSICLSSMSEQEFNGERLEALQLAKHFKLADVLRDGAGLVSTIESFFEGKASFYNSVVLRDAKEELTHESFGALPSFCECLRTLAKFE